MSYTLIATIAVALIVTLLLVALLLFVKKKVTPSGTVKIDINDGKNLRAAERYCPRRPATSTAGR